MILFAPALGSDKIPNKPVDSCKQEGEQELNNQLKTHNLNKASVSPGYIVTVSSGSFLQQHPKQSLSFLFSGGWTNLSRWAQDPPSHPPANPNPRSRDDGQRNQSIK